MFDAPLGADAAEELEHELALAAALDRSRPSLSPDLQASERMRRRLFEAMAAEEFDRTEQDAIRPSAPTPGPSELTAPLGRPVADRPTDLDEAGPDTRPVGPPVPDVSGASVTRAAGEHTLAESAANSGTRSRRRARHVLPADHPDHAEREPRTGGRSRPPRRAAGDASGRRGPSLRKRFGVLVTAVAALAVLAGVTATMSRDALPGDALYGVKRVTEATGGIFTFGDQAEATRQLDIARTRMDEVQGLLQRGDAPDSAAITTAMDDFDTATSSGSRSILSADRTAGGGSELADLRTWTTAQSTRMKEMQATLPAENSGDAEESMALLDRVLVRTEALRARTGCAEPGTASVDDLGPLPSLEPCTTAGGGPATTEGDETGDGTVPGTAEEGSTSTTAPDTSTGGTTPNGTEGENEGLLPALPGSDPARSSSGEPSTSSDTSSSSTTEEAPLDGGLTLPPLLPGLGPVTIGG